LIFLNSASCPNGFRISAKLPHVLISITKVVIPMIVEALVMIVVEVAGSLVIVVTALRVEIAGLPVITQVPDLPATTVAVMPVLPVLVMIVVDPLVEIVIVALRVAMIATPTTMAHALCRALPCMSSRTPRRLRPWPT
jgi:hypothetical protein